MGNKLITIIGPTASGKTSLGIALAKRFNGEIISADSRLVYKGMDIGTAKPGRDGTAPVRVFLSEAKDLTTGPSVASFPQDDTKETHHTIHDLFREKPYMVEDVPHWGIDLVEPNEDYNVSQFKTYTEGRIKNIVDRGKLPIIVGGTGLWVDVVVDNLTIPEVPPNPVMRVELEARGLDDLFAEYKRLDPVGADVIDRHNKRRLVRALEVCRVTGKPFSAAQTKGAPKYDVLKIGIDVEKDVLVERIDQRVDEMIANGLVNEVCGLLKRYPPLTKRGSGGVENADSTAMTGIGYRQIAFFLNGKANLAAAIDDIKRDTRSYAKRQMTWFKRDARIKWIKKPEEAEELVETFLSTIRPLTNAKIHD